MSELEGRDLDRAIAELMGWPNWIGRDGLRYWQPDGESVMSDSELPNFTKSLDALQAPEKVLRDAGWHLRVAMIGDRWEAAWVTHGYAYGGSATTEAAARAAAVYAGLKAWKEDNGE